MKIYEVWKKHFVYSSVLKQEIEVHTKLKSYPFKIQAIIYCWTHGYVYQGHGWYFLDPSIKIIEKGGLDE